MYVHEVIRHTFFPPRPMLRRRRRAATLLEDGLRVLQPAHRAAECSGGNHTGPRGLPSDLNGERQGRAGSSHHTWAASLTIRVARSITGLMGLGGHGCFGYLHTLRSIGSLTLRAWLGLGLS